MITVADFQKLTVDLQDIFSEAAKRKVAENKGFEVFNVTDTNRLSYIHQILHGLAGIKRVAEGQDLPKILSEQGDAITWTQEYFGGEVSVTKKMRKFDLYNEIESLVRTITDDAFDSVDQSLADRLIKGWSTSYTDVYGDVVSSVGPDGLQLFHAAHTNPINGNTFSNIISDGTNTNPALSRQAIVYARAQALKFKDVNKKIRPVDLNTLIVTPDNEDLAERIINSEYLPGSANNDKNPLKGKISKILVWARAALASDATDTSAYWFLADSSGKDETLRALFAERPSLDAPNEVYDNKNWDYSLDFFYTIGTGYPAYVYGSKGDKS